MIYTITTNPSLDYTVETELIPGQVNRTRSEVIYPGGKGINVSISLQRLGQETRVLGFAAGRIGAQRRRTEPHQCQVPGRSRNGGQWPGPGSGGGGYGQASGAPP